MISYNRTKWYGLHYLLHYRGVLVPRRVVSPKAAHRHMSSAHQQLHRDALYMTRHRLVPILIIAAVEASVVATEVLGDVCSPEGAPLLQHPYAFQLFGLVFGYLSVSRLNISFGRYWEGVTQIKIMHSKARRRTPPSITSRGGRDPRPGPQSHSV